MVGLSQGGRNGGRGHTTDKPLLTKEREEEPIPTINEFPSS